ncbi:unnamed protein product [Closterium sp. NIES-54]
MQAAVFPTRIAPLLLPLQPLLLQLQPYWCSYSPCCCRYSPYCCRYSPCYCCYSPCCCRPSPFYCSYSPAAAATALAVAATALNAAATAPAAAAPAPVTAATALLVQLQPLLLPLQPFLLPPQSLLLPLQPLLLPLQPLLLPPQPLLLPLQPLLLPLQPLLLLLLTAAALYRHCCCNSSCCSCCAHSPMCCCCCSLLPLLLATAAAGGGAAGSAGSAADAAARGGQRRSLPLPDDPTPQQLREWALQRARPGGGGFGFICTAQRQQQSQQATFSAHVLSELFPQRCVTGSVEATALGASEYATALGASEAATALGASESAAALGARASPATGPSSAEALHTFTLDSSVSRCFFRDCTSLTPLAAPVPTPHMDAWGPAPVGGTDQEHYFLLVVDENIRYTTVFPLRHKADVSGVLIPWVRATRRQLREQFRRDLPGLRLHSDRGGEFSSGLLEEFCRDEGIRQTFTLLASPQENGIAERRIGLIMEVARTSMIHAAAPHFLWSFAVRYAAHQLNLWPHVFETETSPTLRWTGKVSDASVFWVWGALSLVRDAKASKLSSRTLRCVFLGFPTDASPWQFYHPCSRRVFSSRDVTFDESVYFYRLHPHASHPVPLAPLFLVPVPPPVDPLPPLDPAPSGVSQVDPPPLVEPLEISSDSSFSAEGGDPAADNTAATRRSPRLETPPGFLPRPSPQPGAVDSGAETASAEFGGAEPEGEGSRGAVRMLLSSL